MTNHFPHHSTRRAVKLETPVADDARAIKAAIQGIDWPKLVAFRNGDGGRNYSLNITSRGVLVARLFGQLTRDEVIERVEFAGLEIAR